MRYRDRVDVLNAELTPGYGGQQVRDWRHATVTSDVPASVQPISTSENEQERDLVISQWRIFTSPTVPLTPFSRVRWHGAVHPENPEGTLEVQGDVGLFLRLGKAHHVEAILSRASDE